MIKKILKIFTPDNSGDTEVAMSSAGITNEQLVNILKTHFTGGIRHYSVGRRMLYPMNFDVLLHPTDYDQLKSTLQFIISEITYAFYKVIREYQTKYKDYTPVADSWVFRFAPCDLEEYDFKGKQLTIEPGKPLTIASFFCEGLNGSSSPSISSEKNVRLSVCCNNSEVLDGKNINPELFKIVDVLAEGFFRQNFDKTLGLEEMGTETGSVSPSGSTENEPEPNVHASEKKLAILSYTKNGINYHYAMLDSTVKISGNGETQKRRDIFTIDSPDILIGHIRIRTNDGGQTFSLSAFGPANLNGRAIPQSNSEEIKWVSLANNSQIFINSSVAVKFSVNK